MSKKLCLQWNDFKENVNSAFGRLREDKEFIDVSLVCEDDQVIYAHKVILTSSSPFFEKILKKTKHHHPLIYLKGFQSSDFASILDFLYFGEANVYEEDLDSFLAIAEEIQLKGLTGQTSSDLGESLDQPKESEVIKSKESPTESIKPNSHMIPYKTDLEKTSKASSIPNPSTGTNLHELDEKVKSMMARGQKMIPDGKRPDGTIKQAISRICNVCGKEGLFKNIKQHIEANHLEGISILCDSCDIVLSSRASLANHKSRFHKY